ncbi:hypothetical protein M8818_001375 [Zalaria obscura]|uniref:Uncharacterized protein n=1 Tax=Zalaria obscura TaxID=2024903 RepID=A0ACC3SLV5_9PEZI
MATAATSPAPHINLRTPGTHKLRLGPALERGSGAKTRNTIIRFNHKPTLSHPEDSSASLVRSDRGANTVELSLKDGDDKYTYSGQRKSDEHTYVLLPDENGDGYVLEEVQYSHEMNLSSAPWESDAKELAQRYPRLGDQAPEASEDDLFGEEDAHGGEPEKDNPFDYRHYLKMVEAPSPALGPDQRSTNGAATPSQAGSMKGTPQARPARKPTSALASQPRKKPPVKATEPSSKRQKPSPPSRANDTNVPTVRLDRRASTRPTQAASKRRSGVEEIDLDADDDDDGLVLEGDDPAKATAGGHAPRSLGLALSGQLGDGPISLRSAASSPASRVNSPMAGRGPSPLSGAQGVDTDAEDIQGANGSGEDEDSDVDADAEAGADGEADDDVEDLQLPSPARTQTHRPSDTVVTADEDDDLEKQMLMAMEEEEEESGLAAPAVASRVESDEESEEE